jgi:hypothetical protein
MVSEIIQKKDFAISELDVSQAAITMKATNMRENTCRECKAVDFP